MTIDRKAREKEIMDLIRAKPSVHSSLYVHGTYATPGEILLLLEELGYHKLPKDKPPLLKVAPHQMDSPGDWWRKGAEAQRDADIRWYEEG